MKFKQLLVRATSRSPLLFVMLFALAGCSMNPVVLYKDTNVNADNTRAQIEDYRNQENVGIGRLAYNATSAALPLGHPLERPAWTRESITMRGQNMPFNLLLTRILEPSRASASYREGVQPDRPVSFNYSGSVAGALDKLASMTGYAYTVEGNNVAWSAFMTKTFDVSFMPGASQYMMGGQAGSNMPSGGGASGAVTSGQLMNNQYSNLQGTLSIWTDLEKTIKTMLSKDGQVTVSQATTTVTVTDRPENIRAIGDYLASMNKDLSRQVALQVQVLQIRLDKQFSYGINWNLVAGALRVNGGLSSPTTNGAGTTSLGNDAVGIGGIAATGIGIVRSNGTNVMLNALQAQGQIGVVTQPRVVTLNNQVAQIAITTQRTYLASQTTTVTGGGGTQGGNVQTSLTPGVVNTGFTLYVLPKIINGDVFLQLTSELSSLDNLQTISGGSSVQTVTGGTTPNTNIIQAPTVSSKSFNQRAMVPSGCTLVLSGFRQVNNETNKSSFFGLDPLGSRGAQQDTVETLVLVTPIIVGNNS